VDNQETYGMSEFLDAWEQATTPPPLKEQMEAIVAHADAIRITTPQAREAQLQDFHSIMSYRHIFS
jgi:hypothetical protein